MRILFCFLLVAFFSCKNNNQPASNESVPKSDVKNEVNSKPDSVITEKEEVVETKTSENPDSLYRLVVSFHSKGSGAEFRLIEEYIDSIGKYGEKIGKKIDYKRASWGREGETDVVMRLTELDKSRQIDFVAMSKRVLAKGKYVSINENFAYKQRGK